MSVAIVHRREGGETFLAGGIPDLELDRARGQIAFLREEGGADGGLLVLLEVVVHEAHY